MLNIYLILTQINITINILSNASHQKVLYVSQANVNIVSKIAWKWLTQNRHWPVFIIFEKKRTKLSSYTLFI